MFFHPFFYFPPRGGENSKYIIVFLINSTVLSRFAGCRKAGQRGIFIINGIFN
jgi:hypothetical protein